MDFRIRGLSPEPFQPLFGLSAEELALHGAVRRIVDRKPGYPDRIELRDPEPGESVLLVNYNHLPVDTPYRSSYAIYVREGASARYDHRLTARAAGDTAYAADCPAAAIHSLYMPAR